METNAPTAAQSSIRFMVHYVTDGTHKARVNYSAGRCYNGRMSVTLYALDEAGDLGRMFPWQCRNRRVQIYEGHPHFAAALAQWEKREAKRAARRAMRGGK